MSIFNPTKSIKSRYSLNTISSNFYGGVTISGYTLSGNILIGNKSSGLTQDYIYLPYILMESTPEIVDREWYRRILRSERKEKLKKLNW